jgi:enoyl-CoA hydratase/carnithine racemase
MSQTGQPIHAVAGVLDWPLVRDANDAKRSRLSIGSHDGQAPRSTRQNWRGVNWRGVDKIGVRLYEGGVSSTEVVLRRDGRVATITIDRVADQNRLTLEVLQALQRAADALAADEDTQAVVLTGGGSEFFSMGILNPTVRASYTKPQILELVRTANRLYDALEALPQIVIAALNGAARAGAAELSLACDIRLAAAHVTWALPEALWGGFPGAGGPVRLPMLVGRARALEIMCTGRELDAAELERLGLVLAVHPRERLLAEAQALAAWIAASGPLAIRGAKRIVSTRLYGGFGEARALSDTLRHALEWSRDVDEGMAAHREGRPPRFTGR